MPSTSLSPDLHVKYIQSLNNEADYSYHRSEHLRMNGIYWGLTALCLLDRQDALSREDMVAWVMSCWDEKQGGFGAAPGHDAHALTTLSAIQILIMQDAAEKLDVDRLTHFFLSLQSPTTGSFAGDTWGETDTRFTYIAVSSLSLLGTLPKLDRELTISYLRSCRNLDGGFGSSAGAESHGAQVFTCVGALSILDALDEVDVEALGWWLAERQLPNGGLNGRPEKLEDVCYSWWNVSSLSMIGKLHWIDRDALTAFILSAQDTEDGGIADRPGDMVDVFHTIFGLAGLALVGYPGLKDVDPVYCMPAELIEKMGLRKGYQTLEKMAL